MGRRRVRVAFVAAVVAVGSLVGVASSEAVVPGVNGKIAFASTRNGGVQIFTMDIDGNNQTSLGSGGVPAWSPDGAKIAFEDAGNIYAMNADGSGRTALTTTDDAHNPAWSPDGTKIAFDGLNDDGVPAIWTMDASGANPVQLAGDGASDDSPDWSPDGAHLAFTSTDGNSTEIAVMNANGTGASRITDLFDTVAGYGVDPAWSPDGTKIGYTFYDGAPTQLHAMNADGSGDVRVSSQGDREGAWSPDGTRGVLASTRSGSFQIYTTTTDFTVQTQLTTAGDNFSPAWQPVVSTCAPQLSGTWIGSWSQPADHVSGTSESVTTNENDTISGTLTFLTGSSLLIPGTAISGTISCFRMSATAGAVSLTGVLLNGGHEMGGTYSYPPQGPYPGGSGYWHSSLVESSTTQSGVKTWTTDPGATGATPTNPVQATVTSQTTGSITIQEATSTAPGFVSGYELADHLVRIQAPSATPNAPLKFTFTLDQTALAGRAPGLVAVFRNGVLVPECTVANSTVAAPDPCVASRTVLAGGDVRITVLTSAASVWEFGLPELGKAVSVGSASIVEGDTGAARTVSFPVTLTEPSNAQVKVGYRINVVGGSGAASSPADFASTSGYVTFKPSVATGLTLTSATVTANVTPDVLAAEGDETFEMVLSDPTGGYKLGAATATGTILDDDPGSGLRVGVSDTAIWEGNAAASPTSTNSGSVQVTLSSPATSTVSVLVTVGNGSASAGSDYTKAFTKTVTFLPGQYKATVTIPVKPDTLSESDETVTISLSNPASGLALGRSTGTLTILNDD